MPELCGIKLHIGKQAIEVFLRVVTYGGLHQGVDSLLQKLDVKGTVLDHLDHLAEEELRLNHIAEVTQSFLYDSFFVLRISPCLFIADPVIFQKVDHVLFGFVRKVVVEDHAQDVILELIGFHIAAKGVCHCPELVAKLFLMSLNRVVHFLFSLLVFLGVFSDKVHDTVDQRALLQKRHRLCKPVADVSGIHRTGELVF